jgi:hypothetical protein
MFATDKPEKPVTTSAFLLECHWAVPRRVIFVAVNLNSSGPAHVTESA